MSAYVEGLKRYDQREKEIRRGRYPAPDLEAYALDMDNWSALQEESRDPKVCAYLERQRK